MPGTSTLDHPPVLGAVQVVPPRSLRSLRGLHLDRTCAPAILARTEEPDHNEQPPDQLDLRDNSASTKPGTVHPPAQLLFRLVSAAYERRSLAIGSHWPFEQWGRFLPEHTTAVSLLDRLLHHCHVVVTDGESYRMREAKTRGDGRPST